jgi:hypothetical protein
LRESPERSAATEQRPARPLAGDRAAAYRDQAEEMRRLALGADLDHRREIFLTAARRFDALAELEESVANGQARSWAPREAPASST